MNGGGGGGALRPIQGWGVLLTWEHLKPCLTCLAPPRSPQTVPSHPPHPQRPTRGAAAGPARGRRYRRRRPALPRGDRPGRAGPPAAVSRRRRVNKAPRRDFLTISRQSHIWGFRGEEGQAGSALPRRGELAAG